MSLTCNVQHGVSVLQKQRRTSCRLLAINAYSIRISDAIPKSEHLEVYRSFRMVQFDTASQTSLRKKPSLRYDELVKLEPF